MTTEPPPSRPATGAHRAERDRPVDPGLPTDQASSATRATAPGLGRLLAAMGPTPALLTGLGALVCLAAGQMLGAGLVAALGGSRVPTGLGVVLSFAGVWVAVWVWLRFVERRSVLSVGLWRPAWGGLARGAAIAVGLLGVVTAVLVAGGRASVSWAGAGPAGIGLVALALLVFVVQGGAEEITLRGMVLPAVARRWGVLAGLLVQAALFGVLHLGNPGANPLAAVNVAGFGLLLGLLVVVRGDLWAALGFHAVWNWAEGLVLGYDISGLRVGTPLWQVSSHGDDLLTGGSFGPEGSLVTTLALILVLAVLAIRVWRTRRAHD